MTDAQRLLDLAARYEKRAVRQADSALTGYDNMRHNEQEMVRRTADAANCFALAAALRARASSTENNNG